MKETENFQVPGEVAFMEVKYNSTIHRVQLSWTEPKQPNGIIVGYEIMMMSNEGLTYSQSWDAGTRACEIPVQMLCRKYKLSLAARSAVGAGISKITYFQATINGLTHFGFRLTRFHSRAYQI